MNIELTKEKEVRITIDKVEYKIRKGSRGELIVCTVKPLQLLTIEPVSSSGVKIKQKEW